MVFHSLDLWLTGRPANLRVQPGQGTPGPSWWDCHL